MNIENRSFQRQESQQAFGLFTGATKSKIEKATIFEKELNQNDFKFENPRRDICEVKNLKRGFQSSIIGVQSSAFKAINNSSQVLEAVKAFKNLSISNSGLKLAPVS